MSRFPMWCDDCDFDLLKVVPEAERILAEVADLELWTYGHTTNGRLNHPVVWNSDYCTVAFFGFDCPAKPDHYYVGNIPKVRCTVLEAIRDCFAHSILMLVERQRVFNGEWADLQPMIWQARGWGDRLAEATIAKKRIIRQLVRARDRLLMLAAMPHYVEVRAA